MRIIDTHIHMADHEGFRNLCAASGHQNSLEHVLESFQKNRIAMGIVMGSSRRVETDSTPKPGLFNLAGEVDLEHYNYPDRIAFCVGVNPEGISAANRPALLEAFAAALRNPHAVGLKIYAGYHHIPVSDRVYAPFYELAEHFDVPVVIHTGDTANPAGKLRYSHPLTVDDAAVDFPRVRFVMAHFGNPWMQDAAEVAKKNRNVYIDLSGLAVGRPDADAFCARYRGYVEYLRSWLGYLDDYSRVMYGSDWPLVNMGDYIRLIARIVPEEAHEQVFFQTATRVFTRIAAFVEP
jgi:predicted TIM-barrel fold metal-dependent hydrolase